RPPPLPPLFPYTTLFRSAAPPLETAGKREVLLQPSKGQQTRLGEALPPEDLVVDHVGKEQMGAAAPEDPELDVLVVHDHEGGDRSEEHTSELQSPCNLVC